MPATKVYLQLFAGSTSVPAATTRASPVVSSVLDVRTGYGGELIWRITNGGALGAACNILFQNSPDGVNWFDYYAVVSADLLSGTVTQGPSISLTKGGMYIRAIAFGNTSNACTVEAGLQNVTGL